MDKAKYTVTTGANFSCGFTDPKGTPQPIPAGNAMRSTGYTHDGPCEVWLDDTMVLDGDNCHEKFPGKDYTVDYSSCKGSCTLRWYWLGIRFLKNAYSWQVYKACIPLSGSGGGSTPSTETGGSGTSQQSTPSPENGGTSQESTPTTTAPNSYGFGSPAAQNSTSSSTEKPKDDKAKDDKSKDDKPKDDKPKEDKEKDDKAEDESRCDAPQHIYLRHH